jgi:DHA2 family multidrug resistance protein-like MFS transporter
MLGGLTVALFGVALLTQVGASGGPALVVAGSVILSVGMAPLFTLAADIAVGSVPPERAGAASGISETSSELGGAVGIALLGTIGTAVYRGRADGTIPAEVPADAAAGAGETLGGAVEAADTLPAALSADLLEPAREAFTQALQVAATVSGVIVIAAALLVATVLRRADETQEPEESTAATAELAPQGSCA